MFSTMCTFGHNAKWHFIAQYIHSTLHNFVVLRQITKPIANAQDRHNFQECKNFSDNWFFKNIGTRHKHRRFMVGHQHRQSILQGIRVIRCKNHRSISWDFIQFGILKPSIRHKKGSIDIITQTRIKFIIVLNTTHK